MKVVLGFTVPLGAALLLMIGGLARDGHEDRSPGATPVHRGTITSASIEFFERRLSERPGSFTTANALVDRYLLRFQSGSRLEDLRRAEEIARLAGRLISWDAGPRVRLAAILLRQHRFREAEAEARAAARMDRKRGNPVLFDALLERGAYTEAEDVLGDIDPHSFAFNVRYARLQRLVGNLPGAQLAMSRACRTLRGAGLTGPTLAWCYTELAGLHWSEGNERRSRHLLERALDASPGYPAALEQLAWIAYRRADLERAREMYKLVLAATGHADLHLQLARIAERAGDREAARHHVQAFEALATRAELSRQYVRYLALHYADDPGTVDRDRAVGLAERDLAGRPTVESYATLSWALYRVGRTSEALEASRAALAWGRSEATTLYQAGMIHLAAGQREEARALLRRALGRRHELDPGDEALARAAIAEG